MPNTSLVELTMDKFGRVLIPKKIRNAAGLAPGFPLAITVDEQRKQITIASAAFPAMQEVKFTDWGFPVVQSGFKNNKSFADAKGFIQETYDEYFNRKLGIE